MESQTIFAALRDVLVELYPKEEDARVVIHDAGLMTGNIAFSPRAQTNWHNILAEAVRQKHLDALLAVVRVPYGNNPVLTAAYTQYHQFTTEGGQLKAPEPLPITGDVVYSDKVGRDKITTGDIMGNTGVAIGSGASVTVIHEASASRIPFLKLITAVLGTLALGVLFLVIAQVINPHPPPPPMPMRGDFNVAVAEFGQLNAQGGVSELLKGKELAEEVFNTVSNTVQELQSAGFKIEVRPPSATGQIQGLNESEIQEDVSALADKINADLIIYGNLTFAGGATDFVPEFYLSNHQLGGAEELGGQYDFGSALSVDGNVGTNPVASRDMRKLVGERANALAQFVIGLGFFAMERFEEAAEHFTRAEQTGQLDDHSKVVLYLFQGSASALHEDLDTAENYYTRSLELDDRYARALLGVAQIRFLRARDGCQPGQIDAEGLLSAVEGYEAALRGRHPPLANIQTKTSLLLGRAYLCLSIAQVADHRQDAQTEFDKILEDYQVEGNERIQNLAAEASADLGLLHLLEPQGTDENYRRALEDYTYSVEISSHLDRQAVFQLHIAEIQLALNACDLAQAAFAEADKRYAVFRKRNPNISRAEYEAYHTELQSRLNTPCNSSLS